MPASEGITQGGIGAAVRMYAQQDRPGGLVHAPDRQALLLVSALALAGCGNDPQPPTPSSAPAGAATATASAEARAAAATPTDPGAAGPADPAAPTPSAEPVPEYVATAPTCVGPGGDRRAAREELRAIGRSTEDAPPDVTPLLAACASTPSDIAKALYRGGRAAMRRRAYDAAVRWFATALRTDPSALDPRLGLVGALSRSDDPDGAIAQLVQIKGAGEAGVPVLERALRDPHLAGLRDLQGFWAVVPAPLPAPIAAFGEGAIETAYELSGEQNGEYDPDAEPEAVEIVGWDDEPNVLWSRVRLERDDFNAIGRAISRTLGSTFTRFSTARASQYTAGWAEQLDRLGAKLLTAPVMWRPIEGRELFLVPLTGELDGARTTLLLVAEAVRGDLRVSNVIVQTSCAMPSAFLYSSDHRSVGWTRGCADGEDASAVDRCMLYVNDGALVGRCGTGAAPAPLPAEEATAPASAG